MTVDVSCGAMQFCATYACLSDLTLGRSIAEAAGQHILQRFQRRGREHIRHDAGFWHALLAPASTSRLPVLQWACMQRVGAM